MAKGKNDDAWKALFNKYKIIEVVNKDGFFKIKANQIKEFREARLMAKFDSSEDLPDIFRKNNLAILPVKRGEYLIGRFLNYQEVKIDDLVEVETRYLPSNITTINSKNITSESVSLSAAFISGMLEDVLEEEVLPTIHGRMGTGDFEYAINVRDNDNSFNISVLNSQMEIDGTYEGQTKFAIVEAKNHFMKDFIIRQLYYPYRALIRSVKKEVVPILLIKHNNIFNFFIYKFESLNDYNSLKLIKTKRYILGEVYQQIELDDIYNIVSNLEFVKEDADIPFPQADNFYRVLDFINVLSNTSMTIKEISEFYDFVSRQGNYYASAARYLGFAYKTNGGYKLTQLGENLVNMDYKSKNLCVVKAILSHRPFYEAFKQFLEKGKVNNGEIVKLIFELSPRIGLNTAQRRSQSVISWVRWILNLTVSYEQNPFLK